MDLLWDLLVTNKHFQLGFHTAFIKFEYLFMAGQNIKSSFITTA